MPEQQQGLSSAEASRRLLADGPNEIEAKNLPAWRILARQFISPFIYLLVVAVSISFALNDVFEGSLVLIFVLLNASIGFFQEYRSEQALRILRSYIRPQAKVIRDGREITIVTSDLVTGDLIRLIAGDIVPADADITECHALLVDESVMTGESEPVSKDDLHANKLASGTRIVGGTAFATITATGSRTRLGNVAKLTIETESKGEFELGLARFSKFILRLIIITLIVVFAANVAIKGANANIIELLIFSIALAVSVIPEALPLVTSIALSRGALRMAKQQVVLKRLAAMEDLGSIDILCTDKTGTLTENRLTVSAVFGNHEEVLKQALHGSKEFLENGKRPENPFDAALFDALSADARKTNGNFVMEIPFDPMRRRNSLVWKSPEGPSLVVRGAPETMFECCVPVDESTHVKVTRWMTEQGALGCRVLLIAGRSHIGDDVTLKDESGLKFYGLVAFRDPVKSDAKQSIKNAEALGLTVKILTGDAPEVAAAVAREVGLLTMSQVAMTGSEFAELEKKDKLKAVKEQAVFARVSPEQKFEIVHLLQEDGTDVGFLGEGINDAPALKAANVGLVVQNASDIARESADVVLLEKSLSVIVNGIRLGRETFANTTTYIRTTLASNFGNFYAIAISTLLIPELPMLPAQILLLNLLSDLPMVAISTDQVDEQELRRPKHYNIREIVMLATLLGAVSTIFDFIFFAIFVRKGAATLQTNWFIGSVLTELVLIYSLRTRRFFLHGRAPSLILILLTVGAAITTIGIPFTTFGQELFSFHAPSSMQLTTIFTIVIAYFITTETVKHYAIKAAAQRTQLAK